MLKQSGPLPVRNRLCRVRDVLVVFFTGCCRLFEPKPPAWKKIEVAPTFWASFGACARPGIVATPLVGTRFVHQHTRRVGLRRVLQVMVEEGLHHGPPKPGRRVALEMNFADTPSFAPRLAVVPGSKNEMNLLARGILSRQGLVDCGAAVNVLLIKK